MDAEAGTPLPWDALKHTEGPIPWPALEQFANALADDPSILRELRGLYGRFMESPYDRPSYECFYVPAIIAMAARRLDESSRREAIAFLVEGMVAAGEAEDDLLADVLMTACGSFGPCAVPAVINAMPRTFGPWDVALSLWALMPLVLKTDDRFLRERVVDICTRALRAAEAGAAEVIAVDGAAWTLARMGHKDARLLIQSLYEQTGSPELRDSLDVMDGRGDPGLLDDPWEKPVREWLEENWQGLHAWYTDREARGVDLDEDDFDNESDEDTEEAKWEAAERRAWDLAERFANSPAAAELSNDLRQSATFIAGSLLEYAWTYEGAAPAKLDEGTLREVLLEVFPRKVAGERTLFEKVAPVTQAFLTWMESEGILSNTTPLARAVGRWADAIVTNGMDRRRWSIGKGFVTAARAEGVDLSDKQAMQRFMADYNLRRINLGRYEPVEEKPEPVVAPIVRGAPKVGRNDPCPCGSGKKYKKCCGR